MGARIVRCMGAYYYGHKGIRMHGAAQSLVCYLLNGSTRRGVERDTALANGLALGGLRPRYYGRKGHWQGGTSNHGHAIG